MAFTVSSDKEQGDTRIPNTFIQTYMAAANGSYVKLYLYLQMLCQHPDSSYAQTVRETTAVKVLADMMECTEGDILRALRYWKKQELLEWTEQEGEICEIKLIAPGTSSAGTPQEMPQAENPQTNKISISDSYARAAQPSADASSYTVPEKQTYTPLQAEALRKDIEIDKAIQQVEALLGEPVSPAHLQLILYLMCDIGFSADLLATLYETALQKGKKKPNYIEAIGISWASQGIHTPEEARSEASAFSGRYALVSRELGFMETLPPVSRKIIDGWNDYGFSDDMIKEACRRAAGHAGGGPKGLTYASKILKSWSENNVHTLEDVTKNDESFQRRKKNTAPKTIPAKNKFQNFPQRVYTSNDYASLEKRLLQKQ